MAKEQMCDVFGSVLRMSLYSNGIVANEKSLIRTERTPSKTCGHAWQSGHLVMMVIKDLHSTVREAVLEDIARETALPLTHSPS